MEHWDKMGYRYSLREVLCYMTVIKVKIGEDY